MADLTRGNVSCNQSSFSDYVLGRVEHYDTTKESVISFHKVNDIVQGIECRLSNMAGGFPFEFEGRTWDNSEVLYLCGEFSDNTDEHKAIQERLTKTKSGYAAKRFVKTPCKKSVRKDFESFRLQWMLFVVWQKCLGNEDFRKLLLSTKEAILVEDTTSDNQGSAEIWGAQNKELRALRNATLPQIEAAAQERSKSKKEKEKYINIEYNKIQAGVFVGQNNIGKILMMCRLALTNGIEPPIDYALLGQFEVFLFGKRIDFSKYALYEITASNDEVHDSNTMVLTDGTVIEVYPKSQVACGKYEEADTIKIDKMGTFFSLFKKYKFGKTKRAVSKISKDKELFLNNAFFLFANADRILADSRMFLAPVCIQSGLAYTGISGFKKPTLGIYIEWWKSCEASAVIDKKGRMELVYHLAGSPLSGCNKCALVDKEGKTRIMQLPNFKGLWSPFMSINTRYDKYKETCAAFTLQEVITMLKNKEENKELYEATVSCMLLRTKVESLQCQIQLAREQISTMENELIMCKIEVKLDTVLPFYKDYLKWNDNTRKELSDIKCKQIELRRHFKMKYITQREFQQEIGALKKRKEELEIEARTFGDNFFVGLFPEHTISLKHIETFFKNHKDLLTD